MKTNNYTHYDQNENFSTENTENNVEQYQGEPIIPVYKSTKEQLLCWGED
ncbi:hypothetical protein [Flavobacterium sp.]